ncbi:heavy-metal-associated domain-containing protein [Mangrovimonas sp. DI 80]|uniref:heavy-metal-associated domain-containing protein n=1 Tax=Mangrovimonas sp. DI 80 TaxID=1779330 RepID=UPI000975C7E1|nr:heavy metal-associated domain-containing protein [Mangrovimonas sp. DI 80]OMP32430.1 heavy metal transporter [Mangrovimonas sp. DI 80]
MKSIFTILAVGALTLSTVACKDNSAPEVKTVAIESHAEEGKQLDPNATYAKAEFSIEGMTCAIGCAKTIEKNISKMEGVKSATVDFDKKLAMVEYDEAKVTPTSLEETVTKTGTMYKVSDMKTVEAFTETSTASAH